MSKTNNESGFAVAGESKIGKFHPTWLFINGIKKREGEEVESLNESLEDKILAELDSFEDGWSGHGSLAPTDQIINDVSAILRILKLKSKENLDIQVDDDGKVTFFWMIKPEVLLSVDIYGDSKVRCNFSPENFEDSESKIFDIDDNRDIYNFIDSKINLD